MTDEEEELDFEHDHLVDPARLDVEAIRQADTFFKYAQRAAKAKTVLDQKKLAMDVLEANLQIRVRAHPEKFGIAKTSEKAVDAVVASRDSFIAAVEEYIHAGEVSRMLDKATAAMEQKKAMIEVLVKLHGQQYFAGPAIPHEIVESWRKYRDEAKGRVEGSQKAALQARRRVTKEED